jgi:GNAT superfamily N-acetyltransferase
MDTSTVLRAFHDQLRRCPMGAPPGYQLEREPGVVRLVSETGGRSTVICTELAGRDVDAVIEAQLARFESDTAGWEWKHYSYDEPDDLPGRLLAAGFEAEPREALLVAEIADLDLSVEPPEGVELVEVREAAEARAVVAFQDEVFGSARPGLADSLIARLAQRPARVVATMARSGGEPIAAARVELEAGTEFVGGWGGCTRQDWRGRGVFRALVAHGAALAAERGFRYVQVDANEQSRPILLQLGFAELCKTTPYIRVGD